MISEVVRGIKQFGRTVNPNEGPVHPLREIVWLTKSAVRADKKLTASEHVGPIVTTIMYLQRLREIGSIFAEIYALQEYSWEPKSETPRVIDLGGDIGGFAVLYWKSVAPLANVTLVEANPATAAVIAENFQRKGLTDIKVINAAISNQDGTTNLHMSGYNPSNYIDGRDQGNRTIFKTVRIPTIRLSTLIADKEKIDLLKMDIEGSEGDALRDLQASGKLGQIDEVMMEFHNDPENPTNSLPDALQILSDAGFTIDNVHISSIDRIKRLRKIEPIDINSVKPSDKVYFSFVARKK